MPAGIIPLLAIRVPVEIFSKSNVTGSKTDVSLSVSYTNPSNNDVKFGA